MGRPASLVTPARSGGVESSGGPPLVIGYGLRRCHRALRTSGRGQRTLGGVPEWPKGADCKSAGSAYPGSNPGAATGKQEAHDLRSSQVMSLLSLVSAGERLSHTVSCPIVPSRSAWTERGRAGRASRASYAVPGTLRRELGFDAGAEPGGHCGVAKVIRALGRHRLDFGGGQSPRTGLGPDLPRRRGQLPGRADHR